MLNRSGGRIRIKETCEPRKLFPGGIGLCKPGRLYPWDFEQHTLQKAEGLVRIIPGMHRQIELTDVDTLDSTGVGLVVSMLKSLRQRDADLVLYYISEKNLAIFKMVNLDRILKLCETEAEALVSFD